MTQEPFSPGRPASTAGGDLRLPTPPGVIRRFWARHPWLTDSLITAAFVLVDSGPGSVLRAATDPAPALWIVLATAALTTAAVFFRRRLPLLALAVALGCLVVSLLASAPSPLAAGLTLYATAVHRSNRAAWIGLATGTALVLLTSTGAALAPFLGIPLGFERGSAVAQFVVTTVMIPLLLLVAVLIGVNVGNRRRYLEALVERARQLARERDQQARLAAAAERARIAREMHDVVSHGLTVMVTLADGSARLSGTDPARAADAMERVAETGRTALTDMRRMLGLLTEAEAVGDAADLAPPPGTEQLGALADRFRAAGLPLRFTVTGSPVRDPGLDLGVYRILQEALTNVLRHAPGTPAVHARVVYGEEEILVRVDDDGPGTGAPPATRGSGRGLVGMRERAALYGGALEAGPRPHGGWRTEARMRTRENGDAR